jgi:hypothetical protein
MWSADLDWEEWKGGAYRDADDGGHDAVEVARVFDCNVNISEE